MFTVRVGKSIMARRQNYRGKVLQLLLLSTPLVLLLTLILQRSSSPFKDLREDLRRFYEAPEVTKKPPRAGTCVVLRDCPQDSFSFYIQSGAANIIPPKICLQNQLILGSVLNNAGAGINMVIINGKSGDVIKTGHFDMYSGDVKPFQEMLAGVEPGSVVLMASYDDASTKLNEEVKALVSSLGSSSVSSLGFRDSWVFVGGKGAAVKSNFERTVKNDPKTNKYDMWPELIELQGCIPRYLE